MKKDIIICVDAGGTTSKVGIFTNDGNILMRETGKAGSPAVDKNWYLNIDSAIQKALDKLDFESLSLQLINTAVSYNGMQTKEIYHYEQSHEEPHMQLQRGLNMKVNSQVMPKL